MVWEVDKSKALLLNISHPHSEGWGRLCEGKPQSFLGANELLYTQPHNVFALSFQDLPQKFAALKLTFFSP